MGPEKTTRTIFTAWCIALLYAPVQASLLGSGFESESGSGSGSGFNRIPFLDECPTDPINITVTRSNSISIRMLNSSIPTVVDLDGNDTAQLVINEAELFALEANLNLTESALTTVSVCDSQECVEININGLNIPLDVTFVNLNLSFIAQDDFGEICVEACVVLLNINIEVPALCELGEESQTVPVAFQESGSVRIELDIPFAMFTDQERQDFCTFYAFQTTLFCGLDCGQCDLQSTCDDFFEQCREFNCDDIIFLSEEPGDGNAVSSVNRRQAGSSTILTFYVDLPDRAPALTSRSFVVPALALMEVVVDTIEDFENMTGLTVLGSPQVLVETPTRSTIDLEPIAAIVIPIVGGLAIIVGVIGVVVIIVLACIIKNKKSKVQPAGGTGQVGRFHDGKRNVHVTVEDMDS